MQVEHKAGEFLYLPPEPERRPEYQTKRNYIYPDIRVEIRHLSFELALGFDEIIEAVEAEKSSVGGIGVEIRIGEMRHKNVRGTVRLQHSNNLAHQKFEVADMFEDAGAVDFVRASVGQERQSLFEVRDNIYTWEVDFIDTDSVLFFLCPATQLQAHPLA
jgi:hypothetical protein